MTWAQAARDVLITAMNKGQLPLFAVAALAFLVIWRMPAADVVTVANRVIDLFVTGELMGWGLALIAVIGWFFHARSMRQAFAREFERMGVEKSDAQAKAAGSEFPGSQPKRWR